MNPWVVVVLVMAICIVIIMYTQLDTRAKDLETLKAQLKKAFPQLKIIEKHGTVMICEVSHRNEPEELVFIRVHPNTPKSIRPFGRRVTITYPSWPTVKQIKQDAMSYLQPYLK